MKNHAPLIDWRRATLTFPDEEKLDACSLVTAVTSPD